jgi:hypothetical protein
MQKNLVDEDPDPRNRKKTNPWWVKIMPWFFIFCIALEMICGRFRFMDMVVLIVWLFVANMIQTDRAIAPPLTKAFGICFVVMYAIDTYPHVITVFHWLRSLWIW